MRLKIMRSKIIENNVKNIYFSFVLTLIEKKKKKKEKKQQRKTTKNT